MTTDDIPFGEPGPETQEQAEPKQELKKMPERIMATPLVNENPGETRVAELMREKEALEKTNTELRLKLEKAIIGVNHPKSQRVFEIFLAVVQGQSARGDFSMGQLLNIAETTRRCNSAAGVAEVLEKAASDKKF